MQLTCDEASSRALRAVGPKPMSRGRVQEASKMKLDELKKVVSAAALLSSMHVGSSDHSG